jgi:hypothetical protein
MRSRNRVRGRGWEGGEVSLLRVHTARLVFTVSDGRKGKELECKVPRRCGCTVPGNSEVQHGAREQSRGSRIEGLGRRRIDRSAGACMRSSSSARIRSGCGNRFCVEKGQLDSMGSGHCFYC